MNDFKEAIGSMRLPFLILTPVCVTLGIGTAIWRVDEIRIIHLILVLIGAICAHISANLFNEYFDFKSGLDFRTKRTPFSGGSGALPKKPTLANNVLFMAVISFAITFFIGLYFLYIRGLSLLPLGFLGLFIVFAYTPWLTYNPILCLIAPGLGFGTLMVMGTDFAITGKYSWTAFFASFVPFFLVSNLLLLNQFPDVDADKHIGRKNIPILIGRRASAYIFTAFFIMAYLAIVFGIYFGFLPKFCIVGLLTVFIAVPVITNTFRYADNMKKLIPYMSLNVILNITTPSLVSLGLIIS
ncbi:MAG: prenyltransferase [Thermodesulfobacteriota bacterium]|nr:prenyltransferase [Thermodesulfobacteriota bacterium]